MERGHRLTLRALALTVVVLLPGAALGAVRMSEEGPFTAVWADEGGGGGGGGTTTYTETGDPLARFHRFTVADHDYDGVVPLSPLPYRPPGPTPVANAVTDSDIDAQRAAFGRSREDIIADLERVLGADPDWADELAEAATRVQSGEFNAAVGGLAGTGAAIQYVCGPLGDPRVQDWAFAIPLLLDCTADGIPADVAVVTIPGVPSFVGNPTVVGDMRINDISYEVRSHSVAMVSSARFVLGAGYADHYFQAYTDLRKSWNATIALHDIDSKVHSTDDTGHAYFFADDALHTPATFVSGDAFVYGRGHEAGRPRSFAAYLSMPRSSLVLDVLATDASAAEGEPNSWGVRAALESLEGIDRTEGAMDLGGGASFRFHLANAGRSLDFGHGTRSPAGGSLKQHIRVDNGEGVPLWDAEFHGTYYEGTVAKADVQFVGWPGDLVMPGVVSIVIDNGGGTNERVASIDVTKRVEAAGWFRTILLSPRFDAMSADATISYVDRGKLIGSRTDPWDTLGNPRTGDPGSKPFVLLGAAFVEFTGAGAIVETTGSDLYLEMEPQSWTSSTHLFRTSYGPNPVNCVVGCTANVFDHANLTREGVFTTARFWAIHPIIDGDPAEVDPFVWCGLRHASGACA